MGPKPALVLLQPAAMKKSWKESRLQQSGAECTCQTADQTLPLLLLHPGNQIYNKINNNFILLHT